MIASKEGDSMTVRLWLVCVALAAPLALVGCSGGSADHAKGHAKAPDAAAPKASPADEEASIRASLDKLSPEDRKLADGQKYCPVQTQNRLGSMGVPDKVLVKDQPVFLCCDLCRTKALAHADRTLAKVKEFNEQKAGTPPE
jgi:hypothetical protein